jgi:phosphatidylglycerol:prolipoprotein diacylglycerol transferase
MIYYKPLQVLLQIGKIKIYSWGLFAALAFLATTLLCYVKAKKEGLKQNEVLNIAIILFVSGMLGSRLLYAMENGFSDFLKFWGGGLSWYGGLLLGFFSLLAYIKAKKLSSRYIELVALFLPLGLAIGRIGCFLNWDDYGTYTSLPWGIKVANDLPRHPSQLYEALACLAIFSVLFAVDKKKKKRKQPWLITKLFFVFYAIARFLLDFLRDSYRYAGFTLAQYISVALLLAIFLIHFTPKIYKKIYKSKSGEKFQ